MLPCPPTPSPSPSRRRSLSLSPRRPLPFPPLPLQGALLGDVDAPEAVRCALYRSKNQKPSYPAWAKYFLEHPPEEETAAAGDDAAGRLLEHGVFLVMWLLLLVLPALPFDVVRAQVLPIAARLVRGRCVALAPAAVASIYSDLSALKRYFNLGKKYQPFVGWAPFHILQFWVWERFPELRPETATTRDPDVRGVPRAARWHDVHKVFDLRCSCWSRLTDYVWFLHKAC